jgi:ABC-type Fe3+-siderophore transport system permease subunit
MEAGILVPILVPISMFAMIFGIVYLHKKERMAMIERGMDPRAYKPQGAAPFRYLKWALLLMGAGVGLLLAAIISHTMFTTNDQEVPAIFFSLIGIFGGLGLFVSYLIEKKETVDKKGE